MDPGSAGTYNIYIYILDHFLQIGGFQIGFVDWIFSNISWNRKMMVVKSRNLPFTGIHFQVPAVSFRGCNIYIYLVVDGFNPFETYPRQTGSVPLNRDEH